MLRSNGNDGRLKTVGFFHQLGGVWFGVAIISILINLLMLTGPIFMLQIYDRVLGSGSVPTLVVLGGLALCLYSFFGILDILRNRILLRVGQMVDLRLSKRVYELSSVAPLLFGKKGANLRPVHDLDTVRQFLSGPGPSAIFDMPWLPFYLLIVYLFHPLLGAVGLGGAVVIAVLIGLNEWLSRKPTKEVSEKAAERLNLVETGRNNADVIQAMGMMGSLGALWSKSNESFLSKHQTASDRTGLFASIIKTIRFILQSTILGVGAWLAIQQEITPGVMIAASIMVSRALSPIEIAVGQWRGLVAARQARSRLSAALMQLPENHDGMELPLPKSVLSVEQISTAPVGEPKPILQGVNLQAEAGRGIGVIGPSGSGKSTFAKSLVGLLPVIHGAVRFDGSELQQWTEEQRRSIIGYLPQDIQIFDGTVAQNIARFNEDASSEAILEAAELANLHGFISQLPDGYDTVIGRSGMMLSGGQKQRLALARALYGNPFLVVLDEPNSNLDGEGEAALAHAILQMKAKGSIVIAIAHRPSALAQMDYVLCLAEGKMQAFGPKKDVLAKVLAPVNAQGAA